MYFATYLHYGKETVGVLTKDREKMIPLASILGEDITKTMLDFIENCNEETLDQVKRFINDYEKCLKVAISLEEVKLSSPIPHPKRNVFCLGLNYRDHAEELKNSLGKEAKIPKAPVYFDKLASEIIGPMDEVDNHAGVTNAIDYEVELAVIIGKEGRNISEDKAEDYIFGYSILNDFSARDLQTKHTQWFKGKSLDTFTAMGPYILHKEQLPFPVHLDLSCKVNDEIRQKSNTKNLIFDIPYIISDLSRGITLKPGDIIATGTPSGVGMGFTPPKYLKSGDEVTCRIEKIGEIVNRIK